MNTDDVFFILDPKYRGNLWDLSRKGHVWICKSPCNDLATREVWDRETEEYSPLRGVSSFESAEDAVRAFYAFLGTIDEHHDEYAAASPWDTIHVMGLKTERVSRDRILEELVDVNVTLEPKSDGFVIRRAAI